LPAGTVLRIVATENPANAERFPEDGWAGGVLTIYAGNGRLDTTTDPWFNLGPADNLLLLAPGDMPVDLWTTTPSISPAAFGLPSPVGATQ